MLPDRSRQKLAENAKIEIYYAIFLMILKQSTNIDFGIFHTFKNQFNTFSKIEFGAENQIS